ncbi:hypothetical protein KUCAC02_003604 [Chaenocephalus aceratus]|uniref:Uncharacterized protein n=1 Tax=Chaenocephalus aceratus TaxID=36190 RepID=A0ACB9WMN7_CHAAC|nr:hypothetical protein KUCAC02_003604 [Chaenocephalus aceratus]
MMTMNGKQHFSMHPALHEPKYPGLHSGSEGMRRVCLTAPQLQGNIFGGFDESLLARAEALAAADSIISHGKSHPFKPDSLEAGDLLDHLSSSLATMGQLHQAMANMAHPHSLSVHGGMACINDVESDPRELEAFAERFKQRRIKLGVTQADVGSALANLKIPGVGSLSQSTICRKQRLRTEGEKQQAGPFQWEREEKKAHLHRGAGEALVGGLLCHPASALLGKIAAIAEKLDLKKNVVRVWFCNQRQKQKRMKYSAVH